ncbi:hypothetical protein NLI96_g3823 [Meripilus lineatus]|uniref:DUF6535 domain-containing protein n=1 Tax=Meripilus lineatus TaxID=2056292 RepID=A0AAD5V654_9APHY|nr:hypothetical protein NLI96_g3823 [Physisporinus lineatus]
MEHAQGPVQQVEVVSPNVSRQTSWSPTVLVETSKMGTMDPSEPLLPPPQREISNQNLGTAGWTRLSKILHTYDETKVKDCKEDIDTLLVFAGLFSAVLTAFNIEFYRSLQQDPTELSTRLLLQISQQLVSLVNSSDRNSSSLSHNLILSAPSYEPTNSSIRINTLWFTSLVFSLVTASLGMLVKQWLREYMVGEHISPKERCRVRYLRHQGLVQWRVFEIAAVLPLLLQFSLILFFVGLCDFARSLHPVVAWVVTTSIIVWLVVYAAGTIAPAFSDFCPYNTPSLRSSLKYIRSLLVRVGSHQSQAHIFDDGQQFVRTNPKLDMEVLVGADKAFMDADFLGIIRQCLADYGGHIVVPWIREMIERRTNSKVKSLARISSLWDLTITEQATTVHVLVDTIHRSLDRHYRYGELLEWGSWMGEALACVNAIANVEQLPSVEQVVSRLLAHGEEITKGTLECLSSTFYLPHRGRGLPHAFSPQSMSNVILGAHQLLDQESLNPLRLYEVVSALAERMQVDDLEKCYHELNFLMQRFAPAIKDRRTAGDWVDRFYLKGYLDRSITLNNLLPGMVHADLLLTLVNAYNMCGSPLTPATSPPNTP